MRHAKQSLHAPGFWELVHPRIAIAESAPAAVVMLDKGEVRAAVGLKTDLHGDAHAVIVRTFPSDSHAPIVYPAALAREVHKPHAADALAYLRSPNALLIFSSFG